MSATNKAINTGAGAVATSSLIVLVTQYEHSLVRVLSLVGLLYPALAVLGVLLWRMNRHMHGMDYRLYGMDRRMSRVEGTTALVARTEHDVLTVLTSRDTEDSGAFRLN